MNVDTRRAALGGLRRRPCSDPRKRTGNIVSQGDRRSDLHQGRLAPYDAVPRPAHRRRQAARGHHASSCRQAAPLVWDGRGGRQAARPRHLHRPGRGARPGGQRRRHARGARARRRDPRPPGPDRARAHRAAAAAPGDRGRAHRSSSSTRAARPTAGACAGWATRRCASAATATRPASRLPRARGRRRACTCSSCAPAAGTRRVPFLVQARARERARGRADDQLARLRQGRRPAVRRPPEHARPTAARCAGRACSWATDGPAGRVRRRRRAAARVPGSPQDPLRPHERSRPRPHAQPARDATARACCSRARCAGSRARSAGGCAST